MIRYILAGVVAAGVAIGVQFIQEQVIPSPQWMLFLFFALMMITWIFTRRLSLLKHQGLSDIVSHILPYQFSDIWTSDAWTSSIQGGFQVRSRLSLLEGIKGGFSFLFALWGGVAGLEGAAFEFAHALHLKIRSRSASWFELKRRTDIAACMSGAIAAGFGAPFAGIVLPMELGIGGQGIPIAVTAIVAYLCVAGVRSLYGEFLGGGWSLVVGNVGGSVATVGLMVTVTAVVMGCVSAGLIRFFYYIEKGFAQLAELGLQSKRMQMLLGLCLLLLIFLACLPPFGSARSVLANVLFSEFSRNELGLLFFSRILALSLLLAHFGSFGVFWPLFLLGGIGGVLLNDVLIHSGAWVGSGIANAIGGRESSVFLMGLAGAAALLGASLNTPVTAALVGYELTQNFRVLLVCGVATVIAQGIRKGLQTPSLFERELEDRGGEFQEGRSVAILEGLKVQDSMVTDHQEVHEHEAVANLYQKLEEARYPFWVVVNVRGEYRGLLGVDLVLEQRRQQEEEAEQGQDQEGSTLAKLLEAKDLLYRSRFKPPVVQANDTLSVTVGLFEEVPCVPVLGEDNKVAGLLFVHSVRLSYDREVARRSVSFMRNKGDGAI